MVARTELVCLRREETKVRKGKDVFKTAVDRLAETGEERTG
jgi:hypothetical protein